MIEISKNILMDNITKKLIIKQKIKIKMIVIILHNKVELHRVLICDNKLKIFEYIFYYII